MLGRPLRAGRTNALARGQRVFGPSADVLTGLDFDLANDAAGSNIGLDWTGSAYLQRQPHTVVWKYRPRQQTGYYAVFWHVRSDDTWGASQYEFGTHPYPASNGNVSGTGQAQSGTGGSGTVHYWEIAGLAGGDFLSSAGGSGGTLVTKDVWYSQARQTEIIGGTTVRHRFWLDLDNNPSLVIEQDVALSSLGSPPSMKLRLGASPWTASGSANGETVSGVVRHVMMYDAALSISEIQAKLARGSDDSVASDSRCWYSNRNPTPDDVSDKSGAGHSPSWANSNRPTLWQG